MKKAEYIERNGEEAYKTHLEQCKTRNKARRGELKAVEKNWREKNPEKVKAQNREKCRKDGKHYEKTLRCNKTGLRGDRNKIRAKHRRQYQPYKRIIAPDSQIHHEWCFQSSEYTGIALVEAKPHQYGIIDVIEILDGKITLLTEEEIKKREVKKEKEEMVKNKEKKGRYIQLPYYISDADETLILQAGIEVGRFLDVCVEDAVKRAKLNSEGE